MNDVLIRGVLAERDKRRSERRELFRLAGVAGAAAGTAALAACGGGHSTVTAPVAKPAPPTDADVLNFALNLEYLEANFYAFASSGSGIPSASTSGAGTAGAVAAGRQVAFSSPVVARVAAEIAKDELNHVNYLRRQLGTSAVSQPALDLSATPTSAFSMAAQAAGLVPAGTAFDPYASDENFLLAAYLFEDVGVTAYIGGSSLITSKATYLEAAAGILATEAYHASIVRTTLYALGVNGPSLGLTGMAVDPFQATTAISNARAKLDGTNNDDVGIGSADAPTVVDANQSTAIVPPRTTQQVLKIVYLNAGVVSAGGFFPSGMNGTIRTSG